MENTFTEEYGFNKEAVDFVINTYKAVLSFNPDTSEVRMVLPADMDIATVGLLGVTFGVNLPADDYDMMGVETSIHETGGVEFIGWLE